MTVRRNLLIILGLDLVLVWLSFYVAYLLRFEFAIHTYYLKGFHWTWPWLVPLKIIVFWSFGMYRGMWRYTSLVDLLTIAKAVVVSSLIAVAVISMSTQFVGLPRTVFVIDAIFTFLAVSWVRVAVRLYYSRSAGLRFFPALTNWKKRDAKGLLIIGAGDAAESVLREIQENPEVKLHPVGLLDDRPGKKGKAIRGVPVLGGLDLLPYPPVPFDEILIAWPSARGEDMRRIVTLCDRTGKPFRTIPAMGELINGRTSIKAVRNVRVEDLLGREELHLDQAEIALYLRGQRVLVTGAGGSIGSELVKQTGRYEPQAVGLLEISELNLFKAQMELHQRFPDLVVRPFLADIRDPESIDRVFTEFRPQVIFHAAAYKHVPIMEAFPREAVHNNVLGTMNLVQAALKHQVDRFVLVSSDKAVRPTNVMGATKRIAEILIECHNGLGTTRFMAVRFGNVLGSSGSAVPVFEEQIARGGPVTVTHPEVTRYFMSVGEAAELILQAGAIGQGGEIFILKMGRPIKIMELVKDMIRLHGYEPGTDIPIEITGLRPGEKLCEELITEGEGIVPTGRQKIMVLRGTGCNLVDLKTGIEELVSTAHQGQLRTIQEKLKKLVPEYHPESLE